MAYKKVALTEAEIDQEVGNVLLTLIVLLDPSPIRQQISRLLEGASIQMQDGEIARSVKRIVQRGVNPPAESTSQND